jgi:hypothetical protein
LAVVISNDEGRANILDWPRRRKTAFQTTALMFLLFEEFFVKLF